MMLLVPRPVPAEAIPTSSASFLGIPAQRGRAAHSAVQNLGTRYKSKKNVHKNMYMHACMWKKGAYCMYVGRYAYIYHIYEPKKKVHIHVHLVKDYSFGQRLFSVLIEGEVANVELMNVFCLVEGVDFTQVLLTVNGAAMIQDDVKDEAHPHVMGLLYKLFEVFFRSEVGVYLVIILRPIPMVAISTGPVRTIEVQDHRRDPDTLKTHIPDVFQLAGDAFQGAVAPSYCQCMGSSRSGSPRRSERNDRS